MSERRQTKGPKPSEAPAPESVEVVEVAMNKLSDFYWAKTSGPGEPDRILSNHRYCPRAFGEADADGIYRWAVWDNLEDRFLSSGEVISMPLERLMNARVLQ